MDTRSLFCFVLPKFTDCRRLRNVSVVISPHPPSRMGAHRLANAGNRWGGATERIYAKKFEEPLSACALSIESHLFVMLRSVCGLLFIALINSSCCRCLKNDLQEKNRLVETNQVKVQTILWTVTRDSVTSRQTWGFAKLNNYSTNKQYKYKFNLI